MMAKSKNSPMYFILSVILCCSCKPIKQSTSQQGKECHGTECEVDLDIPTYGEIIFPKNLPQVIMTALPSIVDTQNSTVGLLHYQTSVLVAILQNQQVIQKKTDQRLQNMTATMTGLLENVANLLQTQVTIMNARLRPAASARDCAGIAAQGHTISKPYRIIPSDDLGSFTVYCDLETDGGNWIVFQRRFDGIENFYRGWRDYENGFGNQYTEHWAGLGLLHQLTKIGTWEMLIKLEDFDGNTAYAHYATFQVGDAASNYRLTIGAYDGTAGDSMTTNNNYSFTTKDNDHDLSSGNCAQARQGAWWYRGCTHANLNGLYLGPNKRSAKGLTWYEWKSRWEVLKGSEVKMRRTQ